MSLIVLLLAVTIEHRFRQAGRWGMELSLLKTFYLWCERFSKGWWLVLLLPVFVIYLLVSASSGILALALNLLLVLLAIGCVEERCAFRKFVYQAKRDDDQACLPIARTLGLTTEQSQQDLSLNLTQRLLLLNFRYYFTPLFYFILLGPTVMSLYALTRSYREYLLHTGNNNQLTETMVNHQQQLDRLLYWLEWLPVRIALLGYDLHTRLHNWSLNQLKIWSGPKSSSQWQLTNFLHFAMLEYLEKDFKTQPEHSQINNCLNIVCHFVNLARRNNLFFLVLVSLMTIYGWVV